MKKFLTLLFLSIYSVSWASWPYLPGPGFGVSIVSGEISYIGSASVAGSVGTGTVVVSETIIDGDYLIASVVLDDATVASITPPTGFSDIGGGENSSHTHYLFGKVANSETGSFEFSFSSSVNKADIIVSIFRSSDTTATIGVSVESDSGSSAQTTLATSDITCYPGEMLVASFGNDGPQVSTISDGMTKTTELNDNSMSTVIYYLAGTGTELAPTITYDSAEQITSIAVCIKP